MLAGHLRSGAIGLLLPLAVTLTACGGTYVAPTPSAPAAQSDLIGAQQALQTLVRDVHERNAASGGLDATLSGNARALGVQGFTARYISDEGAVAADGSWPAEVDVSWRFGDFDSSEAHETVTATFGPASSATGDSAASAARAASAATADGSGTGPIVIDSFGGGNERVPLWLTGSVTVHRSADTLVAVAGGSHEAAQYARLADNAVATVRRVVPWPRPRLVVEVPASEADLEQELQVTQGSYAGVAAVTATVDGSTGAAAPIHVFVNPDAIGPLNDTGAQVVISHEATHAATRAVGSTTLPEWLLEGFADYVALRDVRLPLSVTAGQILTQVRKSGAPTQLPGPAEFNERAEDFGAEYEAAWLACRTLADLAGESRLVALYDRVRDGAPLDATMVSLDGFGVDHLTQAWEQRLRELAQR